MYNGTKWKGSLLKVQIAKESLLDILESERKALNAQPLMESAERRQPMNITEDGTILRIKKPYRKPLVHVPVGGYRNQVRKFDESGVLTEVESSTQDMPSTGVIKNKKDTHVKENLGIKFHTNKNAKVNSKIDFVESKGILADRSVLPSTSDRRRNLESRREPRCTTVSNDKPRTMDSSHNASIKKPKIKRKIWEIDNQVTESELPNSGVGQSEKKEMAVGDELPTVDFGVEEFFGQQLQKNAPVDLSRFDSDSNDDSKDCRQALSQHRSRIPQLDGADDTSDDESKSSMDTSDVQNAPKDIGTSSDESDSESSDAEFSSTDEDSELEEDHLQKSEGSKDVSGFEEDEVFSDDKEKSRTADDSTEVGNHNNLARDEIERESEQRYHSSTSDEVPDWIKTMFPAGSTFFRTEPLVQIEASWRASGAMMSKEFREKRKQALRQSGKTRRRA